MASNTVAHARQLYGLMAEFETPEALLAAPQISVRDRWAIIAYTRALQLSQNATTNDVPPEQQENLGTPTLAP